MNEFGEAQEETRWNAAYPLIAADSRQRQKQNRCERKVSPGRDDVNVQINAGKRTTAKMEEKDDTKDTMDSEIRENTVKAMRAIGLVKVVAMQQKNRTHTAAAVQLFKKLQKCTNLKFCC